MHGDGPEAQIGGSAVRIMRIGSLGGLAAILLLGTIVTTVSTATAATAPSNLSTKSFTNNFAVMKTLKSLAKSGKGKVAAILPDTVSSTRYVEFDAPDITKALQTAGLKSSQYVVQNALGNDTTELTDAQ